MYSNRTTAPPGATFGRLAARVTLVMSAVVLAACGGGSGESPAPGASSCDLEAQKSWLRDYMLDSYYWAGTAPNPAPAGFASVDDYLDALRFTGDGVVPRDRWSYIQDSASYNRFFGDGSTLGYGLQVNGRELALPLRARYIEPGSAAAAAGVVRGDIIASVNGRSAADLIAANDFALLSPAQAGDAITVVLDTAAGRKTVTLTAAVYALVPVPAPQIITLANGRKAGYLFLKDFVTQAEAPLAAAMTAFRDAGATELILDLRYNGGGRVSTSAVLASLIAGSARNVGVFATLKFNARHTASNSSYTLNASAASPFTRAVVLTGSRTCSASELVVNGLAPYMPVVTVGATSCGKPVGFVPVQSCDRTYSAVNFEAFNAAGQGRYYDGIAATCPVAEDFTRPLGDPTETLIAAAASYLVSGTCPPVAGAGQARPAAVTARQRTTVAEPGDRQGMWAQ